MSISFKRAASAGFTLIELLIVVIILAIISAIAIPQFSAATSDAQQSAADANLAAVRNAIELYRAQHAGNTYPGVKASDGGTACTGNVIGTGGAGTDQALMDQLKYPSNKDGQTCAVADANYRYGPYLRQGIPNNPFTEKASIRIEDSGAALVPATGSGKSWAYDLKSGQFILDAKVDDAGTGGTAPVGG